MAQRRSNEITLTRSQRLDLVARAYLVGQAQPFATEQERRAAWSANRDKLLSETRPGRRPGAWWQYDAPEIEAQRKIITLDSGLYCHETDSELLARVGIMGG